MHNVSMIRPTLESSKDNQIAFLECIKHQKYQSGSLEFYRVVDRCMVWEETPQGDQFWADIYNKAREHNVSPETWGILNQMFFQKQQIFSDKEYEELWV